MRNRLLIAAATFGLAITFGGSGDAQAKPKGWHKAKGYHQGYHYRPHRHHGWDRGRHLGWYKQSRRHRADRYYGRW